MTQNLQGPVLIALLEYMDELSAPCACSSLHRNSIPSHFIDEETEVLQVTHVELLSVYFRTQTQAGVSSIESRGKGKSLLP